MPMHLLIIHFSLFNCSGVLKISQKIQVSIRNPFKLFQGLTLFKPIKSTSALSLPKQSFNSVSLEWALTHMSFPRILPDSSNLSGVTLKFCSKFDVRMNCHQSNVVIQDLSNSFHHWFNLSILHSGVSQKFMVVFLVVTLRFWRPRKSFSSIISILVKIHGSSFMPSSHNCFRLWKFFSPFRSNSWVFSVWFSGAHHLRIIHSSFQL